MHFPNIPKLSFLVSILNFMFNYHRKWNTISGRSNIWITCFIFYIPYQNVKTVFVLPSNLGLVPKGSSETFSYALPSYPKALDINAISPDLYLRFGVYNFFVPKTSWFQCWKHHGLRCQQGSDHHLPEIYIYIHPTCTLQNVRTCSFKHFLNPRGKNALNTHLVFF